MKPRTISYQDIASVKIYAKGRKGIFVGKLKGGNYTVTHYPTIEDGDITTLLNNKDIALPETDDYFVYIPSTSEIIKKIKGY